MRPGATLAIRRPPGPDGRTPFHDYGPTVGPEHASGSFPLDPGEWEVGAQVPDGYEVRYSVSVNSTSHPDNTFQSYGPLNADNLIVNMPEDGYVDIVWEYTRRPQNGDERFTTSELLHMNVAGVPEPNPATDYLDLSGSDVRSRIGISRELGGVGVEWEIGSTRSPESSIQIIDANSAGGAGWQSSFIASSEILNRHEVYNQSAGNRARVWGYESDFRHSTGKTSGLIQKDWTPLHSDAYRNSVVTSEAPEVFTCPGYHSGFRLGDGKTHITSDVVPTEAGDVLRVRNTHLLRSRSDQEWSGFQVHQGLYMLHDIGAQADVRLYYFAANGAVLAGPIRLADPYDTEIPHSKNIVSNDRFQRFGTRPIAYAVLVWTVGPDDIAMAIHMSDPATPFLGTCRTRYPLCPPEANPANQCGNIQWHTQFYPPIPFQDEETTFERGGEYSWEVVYDLGTPEQLAQLGFPIS